MQEELLVRTSALLKKAQAALTKLRALDEEAATKKEGQEMAVYFREVVFPVMAELRQPIDELETIVDNALWPVPTYAELLYEV